MVLSKESARKEALSRRNGVNKDELFNESERIIERLTSLEEFNDAKIISSYLNIDNEVMTTRFIKSWINQGKKVCVPTIYNNILIPYQITDIEQDIELGTFNIPQPKTFEYNLIVNSKIDLVIVPCLAVDLNKNRIGYGKGYYDRFLVSLGKKCTKVGLAFELQIFENFESESHDIKLDKIITQLRTI